jgi:hypothetical protein
LEDYVTDPARAAALITLVERSLARLREHGDSVSASTLNHFGLGGPGHLFLGDVPTVVFTRVGEALISLLRGELEWTAENSPML